MSRHNKLRRKLRREAVSVRVKKIFSLTRMKEDVRSILHLPFFSRLLHVKARKPLLAIFIGMIFMVIGSIIASHHHELAELIPVHHLLFDTFGYFLHAVGALPILRYIEPFWVLVGGGVVTGEAGAVAKAVIETIEEL